MIYASTKIGVALTGLMNTLLLNPIEVSWREEIFPLRGDYFWKFLRSNVEVFYYCWLTGLGGKSGSRSPWYNWVVVLLRKSSEDDAWSQSTSLDICEGVPLAKWVPNLPSEEPPVDIWSMLLTFKITLLARAEESVEVPDTLSPSWSWQQEARLRHKITKMVKTRTQMTPAKMATRVIWRGKGPINK